MSTQNKWIALKDQQPGDDQFPVTYGYWDSTEWMASRDWWHCAMEGQKFTHWFSTKVDLPPPPKREPTLAELDKQAFAEWYDSTPRVTGENSFIAGANYARARVKGKP